MATVDVELPTGCGTWPVNLDFCDDFAGFSPMTTGMAANIAVANLYYLTGARYGVCSATFRPCLPNDMTYVSSWRSGGSVAPGRYGSIANWAYGFSTGAQIATVPSGGFACNSCYTSSSAIMQLPVYPVREVTSVEINGESLPASGFAVYDRRDIIRQDGGTWPRFQDLTKPLGEEGTWAITVDYGNALPSVGSDIAGYYACELAKSFVNRDCALPTSLTRASRAGVSFQFVNQAYLERGEVGNPHIDRFILMLNPNRLMGPATVATPESIANRPKRLTSS